MAKTEIIISPTGEMRAVYSPEVQQLAESLGKPQIRRASHVEPTAELSNLALDWLQKNKGDELQLRHLSALHLIRNHLPVKWWADLLPVGGPVLGPFDDRDTALREESEWLHANNIPVCDPCRAKQHGQEEGRKEGREEGGQENRNEESCEEGRQEGRQEEVGEASRPGVAVGRVIDPRGLPDIVAIGGKPIPPGLVAIPGVHPSPVDPTLLPYTEGRRKHGCAGARSAGFAAACGGAPGTDVVDRPADSQGSPGGSPAGGFSGDGNPDTDPDTAE